MVRANLGEGGAGRVAVGAGLGLGRGDGDHFPVSAVRHGVAGVRLDLLHRRPSARKRHAARHKHVKRKK